jgi:hypothetical protein
MSFEDIKVKYGHMSSWAVWQNKGEKEKSNVGDITIFDDIEILNKLNPNIVFIGLNISKRIDEPFGNFHSRSSTAHDYKIRYATKDTPFYGAYMTDIIKDFEKRTSGNVMKYINKNPEFLQENILSFEEELEFIGAVDPVLIAFGNDCYKICKKKLNTKKIFKVPHYSSCITKEQLREELEKIII